MASTTSNSSAHHSLGASLKMTALMLAVMTLVTAFGYSLIGWAIEQDTMFWLKGILYALMVTFVAAIIDQIGTRCNNDDPTNDDTTFVTLLICWLACALLLVGCDLAHNVVDILTFVPTMGWGMIGLYLFRKVISYYGAPTQS